MNQEKSKTVAVIVAHPDDETLWTGGIILLHPSWNWFIISLCRKNDSDRAPRFQRTLNHFGARGNMGDLDDGPEQTPVASIEIEEMILEQLPQKPYDLIITHNVTGEYTSHRRHEEVCKAVIQLWSKGEIATQELWMFAYEDGHKKYFPKAISKAPIFWTLPENIWQNKYEIITENYGFSRDSWEAETTPKEEAFWQFKAKNEAQSWLAKGGKLSSNPN